MNPEPAPAPAPASATTIVDKDKDKDKDKDNQSESGSVTPATAAGLALAMTPTTAAVAVESYIEIKCCFSVTIRRDAWGVPVAIMGQWIVSLSPLSPFSLFHIPAISLYSSFNLPSSFSLDPIPSLGRSKWGKS